MVVCVCLCLCLVFILYALVYFQCLSSWRFMHAHVFRFNSHRFIGAMLYHLSEWTLVRQNALLWLPGAIHTQTHTHTHTLALMHFKRSSNLGIAYTSRQPRLKNRLVADDEQKKQWACRWYRRIGHPSYSRRRQEISSASATSCRKTKKKKKTSSKKHKKKKDGDVRTLFGKSREHISEAFWRFRNWNV
jgi:uncharacterized protein YjeT (DUF2065 family)